MWRKLGAGSKHRLTPAEKEQCVWRFTEFLRNLPRRTPLASRTCLDYGRIANAFTEHGGTELFGFKSSPALKLLTTETLH